mmetsp:Transcript_29626/g.85922  ORF Transcript_29626/g.85922 Transcript_29626/m.85922 type:complete len:237 (+) Transcript_29626:570-1280(+)
MDQQEQLIRQLEQDPVLEEESLEQGHSAADIVDVLDGHDVAGLGSSAVLRLFCRLGLGPVLRRGLQLHLLPLPLGEGLLPIGPLLREPLGRLQRLAARGLFLRHNLLLQVLPGRLLALPSEGDLVEALLLLGDGKLRKAVGHDGLREVVLAPRPEPHFFLFVRQLGLRRLLLRVDLHRLRALALLLALLLHCLALVLRLLLLGLFLGLGFIHIHLLLRVLGLVTLPLHLVALLLLH